MNDNKNMGKIFLYSRKLMGFSQRRMAILLHVNQSTVSRIEKGIFYPGVDLRKRLELLTGLNMQELIRRTVKASLEM